MNKEKHIYPVFDKILSREDKEKKLNQKARVIWLTGLSGSGKTSIAIQLERELSQNGFFTQVLDGDNIRAGLNNNLGFAEADRIENIRRIAEVSKLFVNCGVITINCFVSPTESIRKIAKEVLGDDLIEVFVDTPLEVCEKRDVKGLYQKARRGEIQNFTGINAPFEAPQNPHICVKTATQTVEESTKEVFAQVLPFVTI